MLCARWRGTMLALAAALLLSVSFVEGMPLAGSAVAQERPASVQVDEVVVEPLDQTVPVIGRFVARQTGQIAAGTSGLVDDVLVSVGDRVGAGEAVARIFPERLDADVERGRAAVASAEAAVRTANARLAQYRQELARIERLRGSSAFPQARFDDLSAEVTYSRAEVGEAEAALERARADLRLAEIDRELGTIRTPYDGVVLRRHTEAGSYLSVGDPVVTLMNDRDLEIEADVPASRIAGLRPGLAVEVELVDREQRRPAVVRAIIPDENVMTRTRAVRFTPRFDEAEFEAAANSSVTVYVPVGRLRDVVTVHKDAIVLRPEGMVVFRVENGHAESTPVRLGSAVGSRFEVIDGLEAGDVVVVRGNERLRPGQPVQAGVPAGSGDTRS